MIKDILEKYKQDDNILNCYIVGSQLYDTNDKDSDIDLIMVVKESMSFNDINIQTFTIQEFERKLDNMEIQILECLFSDSLFKFEKHIFEFKYNESKLRKFISEITNNSWVKGKKKIIIVADHDLRAGLKSIFHSIRILDFGIQLAQHKKIINYTRYSYILWELQKLSDKYNYDELWSIIDERYRGLFNKMKSEFKSICKHTSVKEEINFLNTTLGKYNVPENVINQIYNYFK